MSLLAIKRLRTYLTTSSAVIKAVDDVCLTLNKGETFCLVGESGSGKSILALSIVQLLPQFIASHPSGIIEFEIVNNRQKKQKLVNLLALDEHQLCAIRGRRIAMIFQEPMSSLNPVLTIGEQIIEVLQLHYPDMSYPSAKKEALKALKQVKIKQADSRIDQYPHHLSGGQRQRVMIAMALVCKPDLLIADEPTTALDVTVQADILTLMHQLQQSIGMSILFITHDFGVVAKIAHRVGVMKQGKLIESGVVDQVLNNPKHPYTRLLLAAIPDHLPRKAKRLLDSNDIIVKVDNLEVYFPIYKGFFQRVVNYVKAVDRVSLRIKRGSILALVGESGSGKSTLGRAILQLQKPTGGAVYFGEQALVGLSQKALKPVRRLMQIAFQDPHSSLNPRLLVITTLTEPMKAHGIGKSHNERVALAEQVMRDVQLDPEYLWRYPHEFSGGQRQRIGLARALVLNPEFIVCDEITSALDVSVQADILQLLYRLREQRNLTLLFITHNIAIVKYLCDETVVMKDGKIMEQGLTSDVCENPQHDYTKKLLASVPSMNTIL